MIEKLFGRGKRDDPSAQFYRPYGDQAADFLYNLLFRDNPDLFRNGEHGTSSPRRPPPTGDLVRLSFLVSDGLYFGEGSYEVLIDDPAGGPALTAGGELLVRLVDSVVMAQANPGSRA